MNDMIEFSSIIFLGIIIGIHEKSTFLIIASILIPFILFLIFAD